MVAARLCLLWLGCLRRAGSARQQGVVSSDRPALGSRRSFWGSSGCKPLLWTEERVFVSLVNPAASPNSQGAPRQRRESAVGIGVAASVGCSTSAVGASRAARGVESPRRRRSSHRRMPMWLGMPQVCRQSRKAGTVPSVPSGTMAITARAGGAGTWRRRHRSWSHQKGRWRYRRWSHR